MVNRGYRWFAAIGVGSLIFLFAMVQFAGVVRASHRYDQLEAELRGRVASGKGLDPRALGMALRVLGGLRHETHALLARGLFCAAGGMTLMALGGQELRRRRRQREAASRALESAPEATNHGGLCATLGKAKRPPETAPVDPLDDEEALLARFEALERQAAVGRG